MSDSEAMVHANDNNALFSVVLTPPTLSHYNRVWLLPVISLLLTNTVSPGRCGLVYPYVWRGFVGAKKKTSLVLLVFNPL